jgi:hypothetical protein
MSIFDFRFFFVCVGMMLEMRACGYQYVLHKHYSGFWSYGRILNTPILIYLGATRT